MFILTINDVDRTKFVDKNSLTVTQVANDEVDTMQFTLEINSDDLATIRPSGNNIAKLTDNGTTVFQGPIRTIKETPLANKRYALSCSCSDFSALFQGFRVVDAFVDKTLLYVINTLLNDYANRDTKILDSMESGWANGTVETTQIVEGEAAQQFSGVTIQKDVTVDLTQFITGKSSDNNDYIDLWIHVDNAANLTDLDLYVGKTNDVDFFNFVVDVSSFSNGWNYLHMQKSAFIQNGTLTFADITRLKITATGSATVIADDLRMVKVDAFTKNFIITDALQVAYIAWNYEPLNRAIKELAELAGYTWYIDEDRDIHFFPTGVESAAFLVTNTNGNMIQNSLVIDEDVEQVKNVIFVRGGEFVGTNDYVQQEFGDGDKTSWRLDYRFKDLTVEIDTGGGFVTEPVGILNIDADDGTFDWFTNFTEKFVKQAEFGSPAALGSTDQIRITYKPFLPVIVRIPDPNSVSIFGEQEFLILDRNIKSKEGARERAIAELRAYADTLVEASFQTNTSGLVPGTSLQITDPLRNIDTAYIIWSISGKIRLIDELTYTVQLIDSRKLTLVETMIKLLLKDQKVIQIDSNEILDKIVVHTEDIIVNDVHVATLGTDLACKYGPGAGTGKYNLCQYGGAIPTGFLLQEDGFKILQESGDGILLNL